MTPAMIDAKDQALIDANKRIVELDADATVARIRLKDLVDDIEPLLNYIPAEMRGEVDLTMSAVRQFLTRPTKA
jgi:hypothetical protein